MRDGGRIGHVFNGVNQDGVVRLLDGEPRETEFGWVFFYNSEHYLKNGDVGYALTGYAPIVVMKSTGEVRGTGTAEPLEFYIEQIRASLIEN